MSLKHKDILVFDNTTETPLESKLIQGKLKRAKRLPSGVYFIKGEHGMKIFSEFVNSLADNDPEAPVTPTLNLPPDSPMAPKKTCRVNLRRAGIHQDVIRNLF